jgi:hypothetical protein
MSPEPSEMDLPPKNQEEVTQDDIDKRLEWLKLDDKSYEDFRIYKQLNQTETSAKTETSRSINLSATLICSDSSNVPNNMELETPSTQTDLPLSSPMEDPIPTEVADGNTGGPKPPTLIRFRRPVLMDDLTPGMTDSYVTLTLSEVQQMDSQWEEDSQTQLEELHLALGDFDEADEFEEVDEFEDDWEEGVGVDGDWEVDEDAYCAGDDCGEAFLDDQN